jgi:hypothetical protein
MRARASQRRRADSCPDKKVATIDGPEIIRRPVRHVWLAMLPPVH